MRKKIVYCQIFDRRVRITAQIYTVLIFTDIFAAVPQCRFANVNGVGLGTPMPKRYNREL